MVQETISKCSISRISVFGWWVYDVCLLKVVMVVSRAQWWNSKHRSHTISSLSVSTRAVYLHISKTNINPKPFKQKKSGPQYMFGPTPLCGSLIRRCLDHQHGSRLLPKPVIRRWRQNPVIKDSSIDLNWIVFSSFFLVFGWWHGVFFFIIPWVSNHRLCMY